jgi:hypothetical protein
LNKKGKFFSPPNICRYFDIRNFDGGIVTTKRRDEKNWRRRQNLAFSPLFPNIARNLLILFYFLGGKYGKS